MTKKREVIVAEIHIGKEGWEESLAHLLISMRHGGVPVEIAADLLTRACDEAIPMPKEKDAAKVLETILARMELGFRISGLAQKLEKQMEDGPLN